MGRPEPRRSRLAAGALLGLLLAGVAGAQELRPGTPEGDAQAVVRLTADAVLTVLSDRGLDDAQKRERLEAIAYERFDFQTISRLVLGRNWKRLSPAQREEFIREFKRHLSLSYGDSLDGYEEYAVEYAGTRLEKNGDVTVRTRIRRAGREPTLVDYRLREKAGSWHAIDVIIESVSMLQNFRSQTQELISQVGPEGLIDRLRQKNAEREARS